MKIAFSRYELEGVGSLNRHTPNLVHSGALLQVTFDDGKVGYADCHPWPELGDLNLDLQLKFLAEGIPTQLVERSMSFASHDALMRSQGRHCLEGTEIPMSNALMTDIGLVDEKVVEGLLREGYQRLKLKMGKNLAVEESVLIRILQALQGSKLLIRLDFNGSLNAAEFESFLMKMEPYLAQFDYFEDPCPFNLGIWKRLKKVYGIALAADRSAIRALGFPESTDYLVLKPAIEDPMIYAEASTSGQTCIITSYMDHPLGQVSAAYAAATFTGPLGICGLLTHKVYKDNPFSSLLRVNEGRLVLPAGTGFGFDDLLEALPWTPLC